MVGAWRRIGTVRMTRRSNRRCTGVRPGNRRCVQRPDTLEMAAYFARTCQRARSSHPVRMIEPRSFSTFDLAVPHHAPASGRDCALCSKIRRPLVEIERYVACNGQRLLARVRARISDLGFCNRVCRQRIRFARFGPIRCYTSAHLCQRHSKFATHRPISASRGVRHGAATLRDRRMTPRGRRMPALLPRERRVPSGCRRWRGAIAAALLPRPADAITA